MQAVQTIRETSEMIGIQKGMQQGMQTKEVEIAENMLKLHIDAYTIRQATGLPHKEILKLKKKLGL